MSLVVQKYGGSILSNVESFRAVAKKIIDDHEKGLSIVVVVSAISGETNKLISMAKSISKKPNLREYDALLATGEQVSVALLSMALEELGHKAISFNAQQIEIYTDNFFSKARILSVNSKKILEAIDNDKIAVVAGFQGIDENGNLTTLGRGGTDITAVALAAALKAEEVQFYKDVDGIFTADPAICPNAKLIKKISYEEMLELSHLGAKVLNPRSVELARRHKIPLSVKSLMNDKVGSLVTKEEEIMEHALVSGVVSEKNQIKITLQNIPAVPDVLAKVFNIIANDEINVDMIVQTTIKEDKLTDISFTSLESDIKDIEKVSTKIVEEFPSGEFKIEKNLTKISIVGAGMKTHSGVASKMFSSLAQEGIEIHLVNTSEIKVSCLVDTKYSELAVRILHDAFELGR